MHIYLSIINIFIFKDVRWLTEKELHFYYQYQPYYPQFSKEENYLFKEKNLNFCETLQDLLDYDFQTFWCVLLFAPEAGAVLKEFVSEPVYVFDYDFLNEEEMDIYCSVMINALHVYQRMLRFRESDVSVLFSVLSILIKPTFKGRIFS